MGLSAPIHSSSCGKPRARIRRSAARSSRSPRALADPLERSAVNDNRSSHGVARPMLSSALNERLSILETVFTPSDGCNCRSIRWSGKPVVCRPLPAGRMRRVLRSQFSKSRGVAICGQPRLGGVKSWQVVCFRVLRTQLGKLVVYVFPKEVRRNWTAWAEGRSASSRQADGISMKTRINLVLMFVWALTVMAPR